jgi:hypothetical protein
MASVASHLNDDLVYIAAGQKKEALQMLVMPMSVK